MGTNGAATCLWVITGKYWCNFLLLFGRLRYSEIPHKTSTVYLSEVSAFSASNFAFKWRELQRQPPSLYTFPILPIYSKLTKLKEECVEATATNEKERTKIEPQTRNIGE